jgi:tRNA-dihydrouridine synthase B
MPLSSAMRAMLTAFLFSLFQPVRVLRVTGTSTALTTGTHLLSPHVDEIQRVLVEHIADLYDFYGEYTGLRVARKHISWYTKGLPGSAVFRHRMNQLESVDEQMRAVADFFEEQKASSDRLLYEREGLAA